jgi:hypothetical protein
MSSLGLKFFYKLLDCPSVVCEPCANGRGATKRFMALAEVVGNHEQSNRMAVICQLAGEAKAKARKASVERPDAKVEPFHMACANLVNVRLLPKWVAGRHGVVVEWGWIPTVI